LHINALGESGHYNTNIKKAPRSSRTGDKAR
jgi:hypothetical protein